jgi:hypothetical protein
VPEKKLLEKPHEVWLALSQKRGEREACATLHAKSGTSTAAGDVSVRLAGLARGSERVRC